MEGLTVIYTILVIQAIGMLILSAYYSFRRLAIEERRSRALEQQRDAMIEYHSKRLDIEQQKLDLAKSNGGSR